MRKHVISTSKHPGRCLYECKFCDKDHYQSNYAKDFRYHLQKNHPDVFNTGAELTAYITGIYESPRQTVTDQVSLKESQVEEDICTENAHILGVDSTRFCDSGAILLASGHKAHDELLSMVIVPKNEVHLENPAEPWGMIAGYELVEESGVLVPLQPDGDTLFQEPF